MRDMQFKKDSQFVLYALKSLLQGAEGWKCFDGLSLLCLDLDCCYGGRRKAASGSLKKSENRQSKINGLVWS